LRSTTASADGAARYEVRAHGKTEQQINFHSILPTEAKNQQCTNSKADPTKLSKTINQILTCKAQRKVKGLPRFSAVPLERRVRRACTTRSTNRSTKQKNYNTTK
jgi:hypothetical protein